MAEGDAVKTPFVEYKDYKKDPDNYVWVKVDVKGVKNKFMKKTAANADIVFEPSDRSFKFAVTVDAGSKAQKYQYNVKRLPEPIDPANCYYEVQKDAVTLFLRKANSGSWARHLAGIGLETAEPE